MADSPFAGTDYDPSVKAAAGKSKESAPGLVSSQGLARLAQSASLGFGADLADKIKPGSGKTIRGMADQYNQAHPLASLGMDLATGLAWTAAVPEVGMARLPGLARAAIAGSTLGAVSGAGAGGDMAQRGKQALEGAAVGGVVGPLLHSAVSSLSPALGRIAESLKVESPGAKADVRLSKFTQDPEVQAALKADPTARLVDVSPGARRVVQTAAGKGEARRSAQDAAQGYADQQPQRIAGALRDASAPLKPEKQKLVSDMQKLQADRDASYKNLQQQVSVPDADFAKLSNLPSVVKAFNDVQPGWSESVAAGKIQRPLITPQQAAQGGLPMSLLDLTQRRISKMADDAFKDGRADEGGTLRNIHGQMLDFMNKQGYDFKSAYGISAQIGGAERATEMAQQWGQQFSRGLKQADLDTFNAMNPLEQQHARLGFVDGMEKLLTQNKQLSEGSLHQAATAMDDAGIRQMVGPSYANAMKRVFRSEAAKVRNSKDFAAPTVQREEQDASRENNLVNYSVNKTMGGAIGSLMDLARRSGMSENQAKELVAKATQGGGPTMTDKNLPDKVSQAARSLSTYAGTMPSAQTAANLSGVKRPPENAKKKPRVTVGDATVVGKEDK